MTLIAKSTGSGKYKEKKTPEQLISMLSATANMMDEHDEMKEYINGWTLAKAAPSRRYAMATRHLKTEERKRNTGYSY